MKKSEFVFRFGHVVSQIQNANPTTDGVRWALAVKHGKEEGFRIGTNDSIVENQLLSNLIQVSRGSQVREPLSVLAVVAFVEQAWEYYQKTQSPRLVFDAAGFRDGNED